MSRVKKIKPRFFYVSKRMTLHQPRKKKIISLQQHLVIKNLCILKSITLIFIP